MSYMITNIKTIFRTIFVNFLFPFFLMSSDAVAQASTTDQSQIEQVGAVTVTGFRGVSIGSYQKLMEAQELFDRLKPSISPDASLFFQAPRSLTGLFVEHPSEGLVRIELDSNREFSLPVDRNWQFHGRDSWPLIARPANKVLLMPITRSSHTRYNTFVVGDLRLSCEVGWFLGRSELPLLTKIAMSALGGPCKSTKIDIFFPAPDHIVSAELVGAPSNIRIKTKNRTFSIPLADPSLPNTALVVLSYGP